MRSNAKHLPAQQRRTVTVEAVIALAGQQNPSEITTAAIAEHMHLTQGALFRHFPSKEAIWEAVMEWVAEQLLGRIDQVAQAVDTPLDTLEAIFMTHVEFVVEYPGVPRMLFGELQRAEPTPAKRVAQALLQHYAQRLRNLIERGQRCGALSPTIDRDAATILFVGTIQGLVMQSLLAGDITRMRADGPRVFSIFRRAMEQSQ